MAPPFVLRPSVRPCRAAASAQLRCRRRIQVPHCCWKFRTAADMSASACFRCSCRRFWAVIRWH